MKNKLLYFMLLFVSVSYAQIPSNDLVARYNFNQSAPLEDAIATNDFTAQMSSFSQVNDRFGAQDAINLPSNEALVRPDLDITKTGNDVNFTYSFWVKTGVNDTNRRTILDDSNRSTEGFSGSEYGYFIYLRNGRVGLRARYQITQSGNMVNISRGIESAITVSDDNWHHIVFVVSIAFNTTTSQWNLDGEVFIDNISRGALSEPYSGLVENIEINGNVTLNNNKNQNLASANKYNGEIDDLIIYNRRVGNAGINSLFNDGQSGTPGVKFVNINATGANNGNNWSDAYTDLRDAIINAIPGDEIWVAQGVYKPSNSSRTTSFNISADNVSIYGGFDGTETQLNQRDFVSNPTILSGDISDNDTSVSFNFNNNSRIENSYNVLKISANNIIVDGVHITGGHADNVNVNANNRGSAILVANGTLATTNGFALRNCEIRENVSFGAGSIYADYNANASVTIANCKFINNLSFYGSGMFLYCRNSNTTSVEVSNSLFINNRTKDRTTSSGNTLFNGISGSSMWIDARDNSTVNTNITNVTFANNSDFGTESSTSRGTLVLIKQTNASHNVELNNTIHYGNKGGDGNNNNTTLAINRGNGTRTTSIAVNNAIDEDGFSNLSSGTSNILTSDPLFTDALNNDYTLSSGSPAVDSGDNSFVIGTTDLSGNQRIFNTTVDMGAYEFDSQLLSTEENTSLKGFVVYPNPVKNSFYIQSSIKVNSITVYNLQGKAVKTFPQSLPKYTIDELSSGTYFIKAKHHDGITVEKIFKQ
ncbi:T9SS type A sorting domain-containing protein [Aquimarina rubra]|uniref:T9SS type A sorting domain-containing protein n=1 Tax=Aquimarina rubra TaxID=1920033 RepID=A0ABW5LC04_9FLAO